MGTALSFGGVTLTVVVAGSACVLVLLVVGLLAWSRRRSPRRRPQPRDPFDSPPNDDDISNEGLSIKSAPSSRSASPRQVRRLSCPDALAVPPKKAEEGGAVPGLPLPSKGHVPDCALMGSLERVQPRSDGYCAPMEDSGRLGNVHLVNTHPTALSYQHQWNGGGGGGVMLPQVYRPRRSLTDDEDVILPRSIHGRLWFSLLYDTPLEQLHVTLITVKDLPGRGCNNQPRDPFVKLFLLPEDSKGWASKARKKTLSPVFNENFVFQVSPEDLKERTLRFSVYDVDKRKVRHSLGHVMLPLSDADVDHGETTWADLEPSTQLASSWLGEMQLGLCYQPHTERLKVLVQRARHLENLHIDRHTRLYVRLRLYYGRKLHRTKCTGPRQWGLSCVGQETIMEFGEAFAFSLSGKQLDSCRLEASLMQTTTNPAYQPPVSSSSEALRPRHDAERGRLVLGPFMYARGEQLIHWQHALAQPRVTVTRWHVLSSSSSSSSATATPPVVSREE